MGIHWQQGGHPPLTNAAIAFRKAGLRFVGGVWLVGQIYARPRGGVAVISEEECFGVMLLREEGHPLIKKFQKSKHN